MCALMNVYGCCVVLVDGFGRARVTGITGTDNDTQRSSGCGLMDGQIVG